MKFRTPDLVDALGLDIESGGSFIELLLTGYFLDGTPFEASDCIRLVPPR